MNKKLMTVAVASALAVPGLALAEATVYGTIDPGLHNQSKIFTAAGQTGSRMSMDSGQRTTDRWGIKGSEDLGGGMTASYTLEGAYNSDTGFGPNASGSSQGIFGRKAVVGLAKGGNSVTLGHDYTANFKSQGIYDPMSYTYTGITPAAVTNVAGTRNSNMIEGNFRFGTGGVLVEYAMGEVPGNNSWGTRTGVMGDFEVGPVTITGAYATMKDAATGTITTKTTNFGAKYGMGAFTFRGGMSDQKTTGGATDLSQPLMMFGVQYGFSPTLNGRFGYYSGKFKSAGTELGTAKTTIVALDYYLSKATTLYVEFDRKGLSGTALSGAVGTLDDGATGIGAGVVHAF